MVREFTSAGPSGIRFSHFKASLTCDYIADFEAAMTNIPYATGLAPTRWKSGINVMIEKKKGDFRVNKLRTILLFEADFNQNNKLLGRDMMYNAEKFLCLAPE